MTHRLQAEKEELEVKVKELEEAVKKLENLNFELETQNAELITDVEILNLQISSASGFDNSMVITERINSAERELIKMKAMVKSLTAERDSLRDDYKAVLQSKYSGDKGYREAMEKMAELQEQLEFFQTHANSAIQERNRYQDEAEEFRMKNLQLEQDIRNAESRSNQEKRMREEAAKMLETSKVEVRRLNSKLHEFESLPEVQDQLNEAQKEITQLKKTLNERESKLSETVVTSETLQQRVDDFDMILSSKDREIERLRTQVKEIESSHQSETRGLRSKLDENKIDMRALEEKVEELDSQLASTQVELERYKRSAASSDGQEGAVSMAVDDGFVSELERQLATERETVERTTQEKVKTLMAMSTLEQELQKMQEDYQSLSDRNAELEEEIIILRRAAKESSGNGDGGDAQSPSSAIEAANSVGLKKQMREITQKMEKLDQLVISVKDLRVKLNKEAQRSWATGKRAPWGKIMQEINGISSESKSLRDKYANVQSEGKKGVNKSQTTNDYAVQIELVELLDFSVESLKQFVQRSFA
eukprot:TRINITY_DN5689_c0_g1_i2.p1 TRINITY_DN5689_c0_g1~~TRINITY_DN5689_c0_g1_i2.p1  ORF type:complete len:536 (-),score=109.65 TRINITY_DN5689_c0_g1_i2:247-1854(-)